MNASAQQPGITKCLLSIFLVIVLVSQTACLQNSDNTNSCYSDKLPGNETVSENVPSKPQFKGGHDSLVSFLSDNIDFEMLISDLSETRGTISDTARINFIVNKAGGLNNLSVEMTKNRRFDEEITRVVKKSSCNWVAGGTKHLVNSRHQLDVYFSVEKVSEKEVKTRMTVIEL